MSGKIPEREDPAATKHAQHSPNRDGIGDGVLVGMGKVFGEDWMAVPNDEYSSQNTPASGHLRWAVLPRARARWTPSC